MTRLRRIALTVLVGVLVTLPTAGPALADSTYFPRHSHLELIMRSARL